MKHSRQLLHAATLTGLLAGSLLSLPAQADLDQVRFGVPPWPGVTVKTEVASQLLSELGYQPQSQELAVSVVINGLATHNLDAYLAGWYPTEKPLIEPLAEQGKLDKVVANVSDAVNGLAVPDYVWNAGVHKISDLDKHADQFNSTIYGIEAGASMSEIIDNKIKADYEGLGDWTQKNSSTAAMLAQVGQEIQNKQWVVFNAWKPHWMNLSYNLHYLTDDQPDSPIASVQSTVWTVVPSSLKQDDPNLYRFFKQFVVDSRIQSKWIYDYSHEKNDPEQVAHDWIAANLDTVQGWLEGVKTKDGRDAFEAVRADFH
ncbi:ABC transporter substrate-binding protein [Kushneria phosphatilytica]|uniref:ABC transporter substrate-binding protein n=1 Tax=Kushneria phosphatilytica TaxID=657387 RepID=A0A1S1NUJ7_9GAMM|nr:ABC transporter substrate-binding protein [Kushneria phosphatilytica]OHV09736.1 ABC transporter substrate-binding protein [Kushneria phosphatilytica]QEL11782.1 ABC transporter substrate-binding protein [Kushneria phosphatilytica]